MPPLVALALAGAGLYVAGRFVKREMARIGHMLEEANREPKRVVIPLEKNPRTGVYQMREIDDE
ncbi:hypothetical protein [Chthonobacter albigriseus]|uniref:hypothetical protein n=1 Tax=Chthonobacter albigriseus TaxID=1683161 RepID=UPI0015EE4FE0|nr:hypothetical protein [Chthonobacter albigriseus]